MLEITTGDFRFLARFEDELAPKTVAAFKRILPFDDQIIHCRWSGESNWIPWGDRDLGIGPENATSYPHPGELALYPGAKARRSCSSVQVLLVRLEGGTPVGNTSRRSSRGAAQGLGPTHALGAQAIAFREA
jgi:hypothetical protein